MGPIEAKRIILNGVTISAKSATDYDTITSIPLVVCQESVNEETESNGTNTAEVPLYSKVVAIKGRLVLNTNFSATSCVHWMLYKQPDGESLTSTLADAFFHSADDTPTVRELNKNIIAKGMLVGSDKTSAAINLGFHKRKTLRRLGSLREGDKIVLALATNESSTHKLWGFGNLYARLN